MQFKKVDHHKGVKGFAVNQFGLFFLTNELVLSGVTNIDLVQLGFDKYSYIDLLGELLLLQDIKGKVILYDIPSEKVIYKSLEATDPQYGFSRLRISQDRYFLCSTHNSDFTEIEWFNYDRKKDQFKKTEPHISHTANNFEYFLKAQRSPDPTSISRVTFDGEELWRHDLQSTFQNHLDEETENYVNRVVGFHNDTLYIGDRKGSLYGFDIESGECISPEGFGESYCALDGANDRLVVLGPYALGTLDIKNGLDSLKSPKIEKTWLKERFAEIDCFVGFKGQPMPIIDGHSVFCDMMKGVVGLINIDSATIEWTHDLYGKRDYASIAQIEYCDNRLYVLDRLRGNEGLHVFERV